MEKKVKLLKTITIVLFIIAVSLISFVGVFRSKLNFKENVIPKFKYGMELAGNREFKFTLDTAEEEKNIYVDENGNYKGTVVEETNNDTEISLDTTVQETTDVVAEEEVSKVPYSTETKIIKANENNVLNKDSYEKTKAIIQKRLDSVQIPEYNIRLDNINGDLVLEVANDDYAQDASNLVSEQGKFEIIDAKTGVVLLDNSHVKKAQALYTANGNYQVYLQIEFTDEGAEILKEISKEYVQLTDETGTTTEKAVEMKLDDTTLLKTYFGEELNQGILQITMGNATTDYEAFIDSYKSAQQFANILNFGKTPNKLSLTSDNFVQSEITEKKVMYAEIMYSLVLLVISIVLTINYKKDGLLGSIASIGYFALTMLIVRYTNVTITLNSVLAIIAITVINYVFMFNFLNNKKTDSTKHAFLETIKKLNFAIVPLWFVAIIFTFMVNIAINSVGMILFWGLFVHFVYSFAITRSLYV